MSEIPEDILKIVRGEVPPPPIHSFIGFTFTSIEHGRATVEFEVDERHTNPFGLVQGGLISNIADSAMGAAFHSTLGENETCSTLELKTSFAPEYHTKSLFKNYRLCVASYPRNCLP